MPVKKAGFKSLRQDKKRAARRAKWTSDVDALIRKVRKAVAADDSTKAKEWLQQAIKKIDKAAQRKVMKKNTASRKKSRLTKAVSKIAKKS